MKIQTLFSVLCIVSFLVVGCQEAPEATNEKIDKGTEAAKSLIDLFSKQAKDVVNDKELQAKLQDALGDLKSEGANLQKFLEEKGPIWQEKLEAIANDPALQEKFEELAKKGGDISSELGSMMNDEKLQAQLKNIFKSFEEEGQALQQLMEEQGPIWKEKLEKIIEDPDFKDRISEFGNNTEQILKELEGVAKSN